MASDDMASAAALQRSYTNAQPIDVAAAEGMLKEAKEILDRLGVVFFLRQGTCLGAIRDNGFIPWDDDLDLGSVLGLDGLTEKSIDGVVAAFRDAGFFAKVDSNDHYISVAMMKASTRMDWACYRILGDSIYHYPGVRIPVRLFKDLKEIDFIGERFLVPNPPEEYLRFKYGPTWMTPSKTEWSKDIVLPLSGDPVPGRLGRFNQFLTKLILKSRTARLRVLDRESNPVPAAEVVIAGMSRSRTNKQGYARFYLPCDDFYAVVIRYGNHEEVLYEEQMKPGGSYVYTPDPLSASGRLSVLSRQ